MDSVLTEQEELERFYVSLGMRTYAGSFFKLIGEALGHADRPNVLRIKAMWREEWDKYLIIGKKHHEKGR